MPRTGCDGKPTQVRRMAAHAQQQWDSPRRDNMTARWSLRENNSQAHFVAVLVAPPCSSVYNSEVREITQEKPPHCFRSVAPRWNHTRIYVDRSEKLTRLNFCFILCVCAAEAYLQYFLLQLIWYMFIMSSESSVMYLDTLALEPEPVKCSQLSSFFAFW